jgi:hypothetical protein
MRTTVREEEALLQTWIGCARVTSAENGPVPGAGQSSVSDAVEDGTYTEGVFSFCARALSLYLCLLPVSISHTCMYAYFFSCRNKYLLFF